jgi:hypothetical protein
MEKGAQKITSTNKPPESSTMTQEETKDIFHQLAKLENQFNELSVKSITTNDLMEKRLDENME